jgi:hypothetical protein
MAAAQVLSAHARIGDLHEHQSLRGSDDAVFVLEGDIALLLQDAAIGMLEGDSATFDLDSQRSVSQDSKDSVAALLACAPPNSANRK